MIKVEIKNLEAFQRAISKYPEVSAKNFQAAIVTSIQDIERQATVEAPKKTGYLKANWGIEYGLLKGKLWPKAEYAIFVHEGTKAHDIFPVSKKALFWKGAAHPVKRVHHPGTKANPFLQRAVDGKQAQVDMNFEKALEKTLSELK